MTNESTYPFPKDIVEKTDVKPGDFTKIKEFSSNPDYIVKETSSERETYEIVDGSDAEFKKFRSNVEKYEKMLKGSHTEIYSFIPEHMLVFGTNNGGKETGFIVMEKVIGKDINKLSEISLERLTQLENLVLASLDFYDEQSSKGINYFPDLWDSNNGYRLHNIMVGTTKSNPEISVYLVDTYPLIYAANTESGCFDSLKRALEYFSKVHHIKFTPELRSRLVAYGETAFEPYKELAYTLEDAQA